MMPAPAAYRSIQFAQRVSSFLRGRLLSQVVSRLARSRRVGVGSAGPEWSPCLKTAERRLTANLVVRWGRGSTDP